MSNRRAMLFSLGGITYDADTQAFLTATGITDLSISNTVNNLVLGLKSNGIWTKMKAIYPFVGGTAFTHKFNLKDPRDLDVAFRLTYSGTLTHSSNGVVSDGTTGYMNTYFIPSNHLTTNSGSWSFYSRTNISENKYDLGTTGNSPTAYNAIIMRFAVNNNFYSAFDNSYGNRVFVSDSLGLGIVSRHTTDRVKGFKNGSKIIDNSSVGFLSNFPFFILAENNAGSAGNISTKQCAFVHFSDGLDETDCANLYTLVQAFQTALGRNV